MVGTTVEVSICEIIVSVELPKRACTWVGSIKLTKLGSPTNEKVVLLGFCTSGGLMVSRGRPSLISSAMGSLGLPARISSMFMVSPIKYLGL